MDSLELPFDLIWEGKPEPLSPADLLLANAEDVLIFDKDFADGFGLTNPDFLKSERCEDEAKLQGPLAMLLQLQQQALAIDDDDDDDACDYDDASVDVLTEAEADQWLNQSMNFFPLDVYGSVATATNNNNTMRAVTTTNMLPSPMQTTTTTPTTVKIEQTAQLIREFDSVFEVVELTHLTPPQSPPRMPEPKQTGFIFPSQPIFHALSNTTTINHPINTTNNAAAAVAANYFLFDGAAHTVAASPMTQDIAQEMEVVEELVRARAENLPDWTDEDEYDDDNNSLHSSTLDDASMSNSAIMMPPSPAPSSSSSSRSSSSSSSSFDSSAGSSPRSESSYDADWKPNAVGVPAVASSKKTKTTTTAASAAAAPQRRVRPYGRSSEDKKSRKKEQNKNAATRYRQKKKAEIEVALDEERDLLDVHSGLLVRCADVQREIKYLKSLMRDLYRAKKTA